MPAMPHGPPAFLPRGAPAYLWNSQSGRAIPISSTLLYPRRHNPTIKGWDTRATGATVAGKDPVSISEGRTADARDPEPRK
ncbi:hypothetical protein FH972_024727 [Carpinus fangiana]|uniref:Uncharacterized protein n=1 Tax=Carpinus fangiana TaxID=176857 RepID=A0A5N6KYU5_9ROSI|nr:hypothetical protein FH972_024727 [Carpinus fangiana]